MPGPVPVPAPGAGDELGTEVPPAPADPIGEGDAGGDTPRSGTNNQEAGVDEPDLVKTDGRIAVAVARQRLQVVDLAGAAPRLVSTVSLPPGWSNDVLLEGNSALVVTGSDSYTLIHGTPGGGPVVEDGAASGEPSPGEYEPTTVLTRVDLTDPAAPRVAETLTLEGTYHSARLVDGVARVVLHTYPTGLDLTYPPDDTDEALQAAEEHNRSAVEQSTLANWLPSATRTAGGDAETFDLLDCADVSRPPEFSGLGTLSVVSLALGQSLAPTSSAAILAAGESVYASRGHLYVSTSRWGTWQTERQGDAVTTEIHAFDIGDPAATSYLGSGSVEGYFLNQFSLSEHEGHLRVATTTEPVWSEDGAQQGESESGVTVLALQPGALVQVGHVGGLGRGERIFAVRFLGEAAAVVTFRQIDPLFLLDLSDPTSPRLTGELELPGVSNYLHPVGEGLLLGVGMDATLDGQITGAQMSLFDISDPSAPTRLSHLSFPEAFTEVQSSHLAFLYWPTTGLAVMPLEQYGADGGQPFVGAVGVHVDPVSGLRERGRLTHGDADPLDAGPWVGVRRSFVVGDTLYTVSDRGIEAGALDTLAERAYVEFSDG
ncbi:beta-propeller domain-containing protein [soil metagenome]